jgi:SAM-dependent methyltransferase
VFLTGVAYDGFMGRWSRTLAPAFARFAGVRDAETILDVGSGTGALSLALAALAPAGDIVGIDASASYVEIARALSVNTPVRFEIGDAQRLRFADSSFDRTLALLSLNFVPDYAKALEEMSRVTRCGGTIAAAVWDYGSEMEMLRIFWDEAAVVDPDADARDERHMPLCRHGELTALWRQHGLTDVCEEAITIRTRFSSFDDYWLPFLDGQGPAGAFVAALAPAARDELSRRLRRRLVGDANHPILLTARAWVVRGIV